MKHFFAATLALTALVGIMAPSFAEPVSTNDSLVVLSNTNQWLGRTAQYNNLAQGASLPLVQSNGSANITLRVQNPTATAYYLNIPSQNTQFYLPINSERTAGVDLTSLKVGDSIAYFITDMSGNKIADGSIINGSASSSAMASAGSGAYEQWGSTLNQLIASNQYKAPVFEEKKEVMTYVQQPTAAKSKVVRGYW